MHSTRSVVYGQDPRIISDFSAEHMYIISSLWTITHAHSMLSWSEDIQRLNSGSAMFPDLYPIEHVRDLLECSFAARSFSDHG
ncbi:hypothetical protein TNCV_3341351 [Trichonephila clavipes]|nr:hypothetical protein TNCV_3341351 [Trichonephila clavipes]